MFLCQITVVVVFMSGTSLVNGKQEAASKVNYCLTSALQISSVQDLKNVVFEECIHQQIQNENDQNEINDYMHDFVNKHRSLQQRWKRYKRQVYQPPQVDEKLVSAFLNSPEAVKMVLSYLDKQNKLTTTTTTTTRRPKPRQRPKPKPKRRPPPLSFFFGGDKPLSALLNEHRKTVQKIKQNEWKKQGTTTSSSSRPWTTPRSSLLNNNNPQLNSSKKSDMQFFGPKDFVPKAPHNLPLRPMRLKYSSTKEFPTRTYGRLVPMPR